MDKDIEQLTISKLAEMLANVSGDKVPEITSFDSNLNYDSVGFKVDEVRYTLMRFN